MNQQYQPRHPHSISISIFVPPFPSTHPHSRSNSNLQPYPHPHLRPHASFSIVGPNHISMFNSHVRFPSTHRSSAPSLLPSSFENTSTGLSAVEQPPLDFCTRPTRTTHTLVLSTERNTTTQKRRGFGLFLSGNTCLTFTTFILWSTYQSQFIFTALPGVLSLSSSSFQTIFEGSCCDFCSPVFYSLISYQVSSRLILSLPSPEGMDSRMGGEEQQARYLIHSVLGNKDGNGDGVTISAQVHVSSP